MSLFNELKRRNVFRVGVAYVVTGGELEMVPGDPEQPRQRLEVTDGQAIYLPATTHNVRNVGETDVVIIETEIK